MIRRLIDYISTPDAYHGRPWAYLANQIGHLAVGALLALAGLPLWAAAPLYVVSIEAPQTLFWGGSLSDAFEDTAFVAAGILAVGTGWPILIVAALMLAAGATARHNPRNP